ncbi:RNA methyltransferase [Oligoflexia bacterium]|nr:RNA methyltransferase [Oligoflexia bacterium]
MKSAKQQEALYEIEVLPGLKPFVIEELLASFNDEVTLLQSEREDQIAIAYAGDVNRLLKLRTAVAVYLLVPFPIARPKALLGDENFKLLIKHIRSVIALQTARDGLSFRFSAAGKDSTVYGRLRAAIESETGLTYEEQCGDLLIRLRPAVLFDDGWEVLIRASTKPLSARSWRRCDMPGAVNAAIAAVMVELTKPQTGDKFLNLMCGSATILIERAERLKAAVLIGGDKSQAALCCAQENIAGSECAQAVKLICMNSLALPLPDKFFNVICADLPWGERVGKRDNNVELYTGFLQEAWRVSEQHARLVLLTQDTGALEVASSAVSGWRLKAAYKVYQGGFHPKICVYCKGQELEQVQVQENE